MFPSAEPWKVNLCEIIIIIILLLLLHSCLITEKEEKVTLPPF